MAGDSSVSNSIAVIVLLAVTILLAALVALMLWYMPLYLYDPEIPTIFEITNIRDTEDNGKVTHDSYMVLTNVGTRGFDNRNLYAKTYRNGMLLPCTIVTMNGNEFIHSGHYGVQTLGGVGSENYHWYPGAIINIDYKDNTFRPGDTVQFEVYDKVTHTIISRDTWPHTNNKKTENLMKVLFSHRGA